MRKRENTEYCPSRELYFPYVYHFYLNAWHVHTVTDRELLVYYVYLVIHYDAWYGALLYPKL
jgi:hypothetical protein